MTSNGAPTVTVTEDLRECRGCGWWSCALAANGLCGPCRLGWTRCSEHGGRLEHERSDHARVTVADVLASVPQVVA